MSAVCACGKITHSKNRKTRGVPNTSSPCAAIPGAILDIATPAAIGISSATNPASGPAIPMSNRIFFERIADRMRMNAPSVPISVGAGIKNGSVTSTR